LQSEFQNDKLPNAITGNTIIHGLLTVVPIQKHNKTAILKKKTGNFSCATTC